jgi:hypothetical protein
MVPFMQVSGNLKTRQQAGLSRTIRANKHVIREARRRHFSQGEIQAVEHTFVSITKYTKNNVKMETYLKITTRFLSIYTGK